MNDGFAPSTKMRRLFSKDMLFKLLIEIKPKLNNVSSTMGRIKAYRESLFRPMHDYDPNNLKTIILTTDDQPTKFDSLFKSEGIDVFRIPKPEIDELL
jgi:hypothetical protein